MTEPEWLACNDPQPMLRYVTGTDAPRAQAVETVPDSRGSDRKLRLFACACCRRVWHLLPDERSRKAVEFAERCADRAGDGAERVKVRDAAFQAVSDISGRYRQRSGDGPPISPSDPAYREAWVHFRAASAVISAVSESGRDAAVVASDRAAVAAGLERGERVEPERLEPFRQAEREQQVGALRDIFGNPFCPASFSTTWRTDTAVALAKQMYDTRDFSAMPILADALQDAGCDNEDVLSHCREPGPHVRGCWVVDLVLGE
jgi:hypothetical protein